MKTKSDTMKQRTEELLEAAKNGDTELLKLLDLSGTIISTIRNGCGYTALMIASAEGHLETVQYLIQSRADLNSQNVYGNSVLTIAMQRQHIAVSKALIKAGADVNFTDSHGETPLTYAAMAGDVELLTDIITAKANLDARNNTKKTALMLAVRDGHMDATEALINAGANLDLRDIHGNTALYIAIIHENIPVFDSLVKAGANVNINGPANMEAALKRNNLNIVKKLLLAGLIIDESVAAHLLKHCVDPRDIDEITHVMSLQQIQRMRAALAPLSSTQPSNPWLSALDTAVLAKISEIFAQSVMLSNGYLKLRPGNEGSDAARFFIIMQELPIKMQMLCANITYNSTAYIIRTKEADIAIKNMFEQYETGRGR